MCIKPALKANSAWTLIEVMVALGIFGVLGLALGTLTLFSAKSFASMANYTALDRENREAMDQLTREIRQAKQVSSYVTNEHGNSLTIRNGDNQTVSYSFNADSQQL